MAELFNTLLSLIQILVKLIVQILGLVLQGSLLLAWLAWAFLGINWKKMWPTLAAGAWVPAVLVIVLASLVWSSLQPGNCPIAGFAFLPGFWWQLILVSLIAAVTLFLGWLQGVLGWTPPEIDLEPPAPAAEHGHH